MKPTPGLPAHNQLDAAVRQFTQAVRRFDAASAQRQQEEQGRRLAQLREVVEGLERSIDESHRRIGDLRRFNQIVGHDLRGPLIGIVGVAELARRALRTQQLEQVGSLLDAICRQSQASLEFLDDLLAASRAEHAAPRMEPISLDLLVAQSIERVMLAQPVAHQVRWRVDSLPLVVGDRSLMRQVLDNLIGNAVKFSAANEAPVIEIASAQVAHELVLHVKDNGVGFDSVRVNLFAPFARGQDSDVAGHGLGLSIARNAVEAQGCRIWCDSVPGQGSTFSFTLKQALSA